MNRVTGIFLRGRSSEKNITSNLKKEEEEYSYKRKQAFPKHFRKKIFFYFISIPSTFFALIPQPPFFIFYFFFYPLHKAQMQKIFYCLASSPFFILFLPRHVA